MAETARSRQFRKQETWAEKLVWRWLRGRRFSHYKFRRQHPIGDYSLDFYCKEAELAIELDGSQHGFPEQQNHDTRREEFLKSRGIKTLRFWNSYLRLNRQSVRDTIFNELQKRAPHPLPGYTRPMISGKSVKGPPSPGFAVLRRAGPLPSPPGEGKSSADGLEDQSRTQPHHHPKNKNHPTAPPLLGERAGVRAGSCAEFREALTKVKNPNIL